MCYNVQAFGPVAQLGERSVRIREVESSSLFRSTKIGKHHKALANFTYSLFTIPSSLNHDADGA